MESTDSRKNNENERSSDPLNHTMEIMKAAFPFLDSDTQKSMDFLLKASDMISSLQNIQNTEHISAYSLRKKNIDLEGLLNNIRNVCYEKEREIIDMILNMIQAKNMFQMYHEFSKTMSSSSNDTEYDSNSDNNFTTMFGNGNMADILGTMLSPEQKDTFDNIQMLFQAANN